MQFLLLSVSPPAIDIFDPYIKHLKYISDLCDLFLAYHIIVRKIKHKFSDIHELKCLIETSNELCHFDLDHLSTLDQFITKVLNLIAKGVLLSLLLIIIKIDIQFGLRSSRSSMENRNPLIIYVFLILETEHYLIDLFQQLLKE